MAIARGRLALGCGPRRVRRRRVPARPWSSCFRTRRRRRRPRRRVESRRGSRALAAARESTTASPETSRRRRSRHERGRRRSGCSATRCRPCRRRREHFTLYFRFESDELTDESRALVPRDSRSRQERARSRRRRRRAHRHDRDARRQLRARAEARQRDSRRSSSRPARRVADRGDSHGEADLLVKTADEVLEPRNRRVEITVR